MVILEPSTSYTTTETVNSAMETNTVIFTVTQVEPDEEERAALMETDKNKSQKLYTSFVKGSTGVTGVYQVPRGEQRWGGMHGAAGFNADLDRLGPEPCDSPPPPPTDPAEIRKAFRQKMHRCKLCKNRFIEKDIYERHLRDNHPGKYEEYMEEQARTMEEQRLGELEQIRREEIKSGGFILPAREVDEMEAMADPCEIKLPEEDDYGYYFARDEFGAPALKRRPYKKKVSPQCPFCDKRFRNDNSLKKHIAKKHPECVSFTQCNKCFKALKSADEAPGHLCELLHICWECSPARNMCAAERLENHRKKFHRGAYSGFKCNECARKFLTPRKLRKHKKMSHVVRKPYKCHFCDDYFPTDMQAALHERIHTGKVKFECNICDFRTNRYVRLHEHKRKEHGYICVICQEKTVEYSELKYHTLEKHGGYLSSESQAVCIESPRVWILFKGE